MTNLAITSACNQRCSYCFAADQRAEDGRAAVYLDADAFDRRLDFIAGSGIDQARLMGGEPTLHPQLPKLADRVLARGLKLAIFSNGLMPAHTLTFISALPAERCSVLVNINEPAVAGKEAHERRCAALARLTERATLSFNICRPDCDLDFLLRVIDETHCQRAVRLGLAHPTLTGTNAHLRTSQYRFVGSRIVEFARRAMAFGVSLQFDCCFVPCMFDDSQRAELLRTGARLAWHCAPVPDIDLDGRLIHCYPLGTLPGVALATAGDVAAARRILNAQVRGYREAGIFADCGTCDFNHSGECAGGCLSTTMRRFRRASFSVAAPAEGLLS